MRARRFAGDPVAGESRSASLVAMPQRFRRWRSNFSVQRHCSLERHQGHVMADITGKTFVEAARSCFEPSNFYFDTRCPQLLEAESADLRIGIRHRSDHAV